MVRQLQPVENVDTSRLLAIGESGHSLRLPPWMAVALSTLLLPGVLNIALLIYKVVVPVMVRELQSV